MRACFPCTQVYITGLPPDITEKEVGEFFGSIGLLKQDKKTKQPKIWLMEAVLSSATQCPGPKRSPQFGAERYRNKDTGALKGDGTVSYGKRGAGKGQCAIELCALLPRLLLLLLLLFPLLHLIISAPACKAFAFLPFNGILPLTVKTHSHAASIMPHCCSDDPFTAASAVDWFNDKEWKGSKLTVSLAVRGQFMFKMTWFWLETENVFWIHMRLRAHTNAHARTH
eukprot:1158015-Pelagomonas_calceolata.AAC.3